MSSEEYQRYIESEVKQRAGGWEVLLKKSDRKCVVCAEKTLLIIGEGYDNRTKYVCGNKICNCQYSLA